MRQLELEKLIENKVRKALKEYKDVTNYDMTLPALGDTKKIRIGKDGGEYMYLLQDGNDKELKLDRNQADNLARYIRIHFLRES